MSGSPEALNSDGFFSYLRPSVEAALNSSDQTPPRAGSLDEPGGTNFGSPSPSALLSRLLSGKRKASDEAGGGASSSSPPAKCPTLDSKAAASSSSTASSSKARAAPRKGKAKAAAREADEEQQAGTAAASSSSSPAALGPGSLVLHDFLVPLQDPWGEGEGDAPPPSKKAKKPKGKRGGGKGGASSSSAASPWPGFGGSWRSASLADAVFSCGWSSKRRPLQECLGLEGSGPHWAKYVDLAKCGSTAITSLLSKVNFSPDVFSYIEESCWPEKWWEWRSLPESVWKKKPDLDVEMVDWNQEVVEVLFCADLMNSEGPDQKEALRIQIRLNPDVLARRLPSSALDAGGDEEGVANAKPFLKHRKVAWIPFFEKPKKKKKKKNQQGPEEPVFKLLDNKSDALALQPPHFKRHPLRTVQLRSLGWMQRCEDHPEPFDVPMSNLFAPLDGVEDRWGGANHHASWPAFKWGWDCHLRYSEVHEIRGGILGDAMGYGKTATTIGLIDSRRGRAAPPAPAALRPDFFASEATLVLVPSNLMDQWLGEFRKFLEDETGKSPLRIFAIKTAANLKSATVGDLCHNYDVVLCTYRLLFSPVYRERLLAIGGRQDEGRRSDSAVVRASANVPLVRANTRRFKQNPSEYPWKTNAKDLRISKVDDLKFPVLEQFWWKRVVLDEFHELEAMEPAQFLSLQHICGSFRWGLTGTPPTRAFNQISTLAELFQVGRLPFSGDDGGQAVAQQFLDHFARKNTSNEVLSVKLTEHIVDIHQTLEERAIYLAALHDGGNNGGGGDGAAHSAATTETLLKLCSHFEQGQAKGLDAGGECQRLVGVKDKASDKAAAALREATSILETMERLLSQFLMPPPMAAYSSTSSSSGAPGAGQPLSPPRPTARERHAALVQSLRVRLLGAAAAAEAEEKKKEEEEKQKEDEKEKKEEENEQQQQQQQQQPEQAPLTDEELIKEDEDEAEKALAAAKTARRESAALAAALEEDDEFMAALAAATEAASKAVGGGGGGGSAGEDSSAEKDAQEREEGRGVEEEGGEHDEQMKEEVKDEIKEVVKEEVKEEGEMEEHDEKEGVEPKVGDDDEYGSALPAPLAPADNPLMADGEGRGNTVADSVLSQVVNNLADVRFVPTTDLRRQAEQRLAKVKGKNPNKSSGLPPVVVELLNATKFTEDKLRLGVEEATRSFNEAVDNLLKALKSQSFFDKVLSAINNDASSRECSICLDEEIPVDQLSITSCAHVFHTDCIREVVLQFGACPECRGKLNAARDITPIMTELNKSNDDSNNNSSSKSSSSCSCHASSSTSKSSSSKAKKDEGDQFPVDTPEAKALAATFGSKLTAVSLCLQKIVAKGEKAIVFCQWEELKRKISNSFEAMGVKHLQLQGSVFERGQTIRRFQEEQAGEGGASVLLLSLESAASGTNLTAANHVVFVHPMAAENAEKAVAYEAQAIGRCRRWGQEKDEVHCWRFVTRSTVEETITAAHRKELWDNHLQGSIGSA